MWMQLGFAVSIGLALLANSYFAYMVWNWIPYEPWLVDEAKANRNYKIRAVIRVIGQILAVIGMLVIAYGFLVAFASVVL